MKYKLIQMKCTQCGEYFRKRVSTVNKKVSKICNNCKERKYTHATTATISHDDGNESITAME